MILSHLAVLNTCVCMCILSFGMYLGMRKLLARFLAENDRRIEEKPPPSRLIEPLNTTPLVVFSSLPDDLPPVSQHFSAWAFVTKTYAWTYTIATLLVYIHVHSPMTPSTVTDQLFDDQSARSTLSLRTVEHRHADKNIKKVEERHGMKAP